MSVPNHLAGAMITISAGDPWRCVAALSCAADGRGVEARVWWVGGRPVLVGAHPDTPETAPSPDLTRVEPLVRRLGCLFVTTDLALRTDGAWRVVEVGDGQVSDLPEGTDPAELVAALTAGAGDAW